jgi:hypothetical protein
LKVPGLAKKWKYFESFGVGKNGNNLKVSVFAKKWK